MGRHTGLTFNALREANLDRVGIFTNNKGETAHSKEDGSDWTPAQWLQAVVGELGEYANIRKKFERGDISRFEFRQAAKEELADVQIYLDLLANALALDLGKATRAKFNKKSREKNLHVCLLYEDSVRKLPSELDYSYLTDREN